MERQIEQAEPWRALCQQAVVENDVDKLNQLTKEINRLLTEKDDRQEVVRC